VATDLQHCLGEMERGHKQVTTWTKTSYYSAGKVFKFLTEMFTSVARSNDHDCSYICTLNVCILCNVFFVNVKLYDFCIAIVTFLPIVFVIISFVCE